MSFLDAIDVLHAGQGAAGNGVIQAEHHHGITANNPAAHLHGSDVDVVLTKQRTQIADDAWHITVPGEQHVPAWGNVQRELINAGDAQISIGKDRTGNGVTAIGIAAGQLQRSASEITASFILDFKNMHAALLGFQRCVDVVDAIPQG